MLHAPAEESPRISAIRIMHFSIAPSIPMSGKGKGERESEKERGRKRESTMTYIAPSKSRYISRVRANPPPAAHPTPFMRVGTRVFACVSIPHSPQLAVDIKYVSH